MKKMLLLALALLVAMMGAALAEEETPAVIPAQIVPQAEGFIPMADAIKAAESAMAVLPAECLTHAELVRMTDDSHRWVVSIFEMTAFADGWCFEVDALTGEVTGAETTNIGFFFPIYERWEQVKGNQALWSLEDKLLFDTLYTMLPTCGMPVEGDMTHGEALEVAVKVLGLTGASDYQIGYGYLKGAGDGVTNGMWEVYFVKDNEVVYKVNLDAVTGDVYLIEPDEEGNG